VAETLVGAPGTVTGVTLTLASGVTLLEAVEALEVPTELVAVTVKVYAVPFVSPVTVNGEPAPLTKIFPGLEVTV
jgi:hypothetical protein